MHESWNVWLVGDSVRWAAAAIFLLGIASCALGTPNEGGSTRLLGVIGGLTGALLVIALVTGSLTVLAWAVLADLVLWLGATLRHAFGTGTRIASA